MDVGTVGSMEYRAHERKTGREAAEIVLQGIGQTVSMIYETKNISTWTHRRLVLPLPPRMI